MEWVVNATLRLLYPPVNISGANDKGGRVGPRARQD